MISAGEALGPSTLAVASGITPCAMQGITPMFLTRASATRRGEPAPENLTGRVPTPASLRLRYFTLSGAAGGRSALCQMLPAVVVTDAPLAVRDKRQSVATLSLWNQSPPRDASPSGRRYTRDGFDAQVLRAIIGRNVERMQRP